MKKAVWTFCKKHISNNGLTISFAGGGGVSVWGKLYFCSDYFPKPVGECLYSFGLLFTSKFESKYFLLDAFLDVAVVAAIILLFGFVFNWFSSTPIWVLIIMACITYGIGTCFQVFRARGRY